MEEKTIAKNEEELIMLMRDRNFDKEQAIGIYLISVKRKIIDEVIAWLKSNPEANEEDAWKFILDD